MRNSSRSRYAVAALVDLAQSQTRRPVALSDIAQRQDVSVSYLEQVFALLRQNGFVKSVRGPGGGYLLARAANDIRISPTIYVFPMCFRPLPRLPRWVLIATTQRGRVPGPA
ncbi:MAG: Rrf2 family transcriptional regulator [Rhodospirillaceae bacterium]|nr:Rrf2 family transcriptional regulator [Rhodospirillaceae bacterium]